MTAAPHRAQAAEFKLGDPVEVMYAGKWTPGVVTKGLESGTYVVNNGNMVMYINVGDANIRPRQMGAAEKAEADRSEQALAHRPTGNGIGAQYGAREPVACKDRRAQPTAANVKQYVLCGMEGLDFGNNLVLLTNLTVQMAPARAFLYGQDSRDDHIDVRAPVIDIRGGYKSYQCGKPILGGGAFTATHNCVSYDQPEANGSCYKDTFGDWHCSMAGNRPASSSQVKDQMPPTDNP
jgi:hypothetical protein